MLLGQLGRLDVVALTAFAVILGLRVGLPGGTSNAMLRGVVPDEELPRQQSLTGWRDVLTGLLWIFKWPFQRSLAICSLSLNGALNRLLVSKGNQGRQQAAM